MDAKEFANWLAGLLYAIGFVPYILSIWWTRELPAGAIGKTVPEKASWTVWAIIDTILFFGMLARNSVNGQIIAASIGIWATVIFAMKFGRPGWKPRDKWCLSISLFGLILWQLFSNPEIGILVGLAAGCIAAWPTFEEAWKHPGSEPFLSKLGWITFAVGSVVALFAVPKWDIANAAIPIVFALIDIPATLIICLRPAK